MTTPAIDRAGFVEPAYSSDGAPGTTLADVLPAVARALGVDVGFAPSGFALEPAPAYVVMLVDGLGRELLARHPEQAPFLHSLLGGQAATCGVPSTTATSLTSLGTALAPGEHGVLGFTNRNPETGKLLNALFWDKRVDPVLWQPHPTAFDRLARAGVSPTVVSKRDFADSGLTRAGQRGARYVGADDVAERVAGAVAASAERPSLTYVYDGNLDWHGHRAGIDSERWRTQLRDIDEDVQELRDALPREVRLLVVADHGMVDSSAEDHVDVDEHPALREGVELLGGEARFRHVYCRPGAVEDVRSAWSQLLGDRAVVLTRDEAVARGWFGPIAPHARLRLGDVIAAATGTTALMSSKDFAYEMTLIGLHGSLTSAEMQIPLLVC